MQNIMQLQQTKIDNLTSDLSKSRAECKSLRHQLTGLKSQNEALKRNNLDLATFASGFSQLALAQLALTETKLRQAGFDELAADMVRQHEFLKSKV